MKIDKEGMFGKLMMGLANDKALGWARQRGVEMQRLMSYYKCAMMEIETKFKVLDEEYSLQHDRNPINSIKSRIKKVPSIMEKLERKGLPLTVESIEKNLNDVA